MANRGRPTLQKRERERGRIEKQKNRDARRQESKERRASAPERSGNVDPDIAHIAAGPQPLADWQAEALEQDKQQEEDDLQDAQDT